MKKEFCVEKYIYAILLFILVTESGYCGAEFVKDINIKDRVDISTPGAYLLSYDENYVYACIGDNLHGGELWKTDGTSAGSEMIKDIFPGTDGSRIVYMTKMYNSFYFMAKDGEHLSALWRTNGTTAGTVLVKDFDFGNGYQFKGFLRIGSLLYFKGYGNDGEELWKTDGSSAGTIQVKDIRPGVENSSSDFYMNLNNTLYFFANDGTNGLELWKSDGTEAGTVMVKDIYPGSVGCYPGQPVIVNNIMYFQARNSSGNSEIWRSDGSEAGTTILVDLNPSGGSQPENLTEFNGALYFSANDALCGKELWKYDGSEISMVKDIVPGGGSSDILNLTVFKNKLFFFAKNSLGISVLWMSDGTEAGTQILRDTTNSSTSSIGSFYPGENYMYYIYIDESSSRNLWRTDGTSAGTQMAADLSGYTLFLNNFLYYKGKLFMNALDDTINGYEIRVYDEATGELSLIRNFMIEPTNSRLKEMTPAGTKLYFRANDGLSGEEMWVTDSKTLNTFMLKEINLSDNSLTNTSETVMGSYIYFNQTNDTYGEELWKSGGLGINTTLVKDINFSGDSSPSNLCTVGSYIFFSADNGKDGFELYKSQGTSATTTLIKDINPDGSSIAPYDSTFQSLVVNDRLYFEGNDGSNGSELWVSDGTSAGTTMIADINPGPNGSSPSSLTYIPLSALSKKADISLGFNIFFGAYDVVNGKELWKYSSLTGAVSMIKDINSGTLNSDPHSIVYLDDRVLFLAYNAGENLYKTDGTEAGTVCLKAFTNFLYYPQYLTRLGNTLLFAAGDIDHGNELWITDGTSVNTRILKDIYPGKTSSAPGDFLVVNNALYFTAMGDKSGREIWKTDGTEAGTVVACELNPGTDGSYPEDLTLVGDYIYFTALNAENILQGRELWRMPLKINQNGYFLY